MSKAKIVFTSTSGEKLIHFEKNNGNRHLLITKPGDSKHSHTVFTRNGKTEYNRGG